MTPPGDQKGGESRNTKLTNVLWTSDGFFADWSPVLSHGLLDQFQTQSQGLGDRLHRGDLRVAAILDIAHRIGVRNAGELGECVPGQALSFPRLTNLRGHARRRGRAPGALSGGE